MKKIFLVVTMVALCGLSVNAASVKRCVYTTFVDSKYKSVEQPFRIKPFAEFKVKFITEHGLLITSDKTEPLAYLIPKTKILDDRKIYYFGTLHKEDGMIVISKKNSEQKSNYFFLVGEYLAPLSCKDE